MTIHDTALVLFLKQTDPILHAKLLELRDAIEDWLSYVPQTFPHYTRHTARHSDEIVAQLSKLLFEGSDPRTPTPHLSSIEAYILAAAAYLHDAGMVVSDREKMEILSGEEWKAWATNGGSAAPRLRQLEIFRLGSQPADSTIRNFLADIQLRFLIAEFVRARHHLRSSNVIHQHEPLLARFAFNDPILQRTIEAVCVGHGLERAQLEDRERYPTQRDVRGQKTNVRLLAMLFRLGDLLDMTYDRACPLLLNVACPLPANSLAHWTQYGCIVHRLTSPEKIEITAECKTQDEHRVLRDWCQWIVDEAANATLSTTHAERHRHWRAPIATIQGDSPTILIRPAAGATYIPSTWKMELDQTAIFERLIYHVYDDPNAFIRELLQNAFDATRCRLHLELQAEGLPAPEFISQVSPDRLERYPVTVSIEPRRVINEFSGEELETQVVVVDDNGTGMDRSVIENYLLQVGRSYYTSPEFKKRFGFTPTSRFGVGFLSVFAVSDEILLETYNERSRDGPLRLKLTGPRTYILTEHGTRRTPGTRIEVMLRAPLDPGDLTRIVRYWCKRVEFPIDVREMGTTTRIRAESVEDFLAESPDLSEPGATFSIKAFPINHPGIFGEFYVFSHDGPKGDRWDLHGWAKHRYPMEYPSASSPELPHSVICLHGVHANDGRHLLGHYTSGLEIRADIRIPGAYTDLSRHGFLRGTPRDPISSAILSQLGKLLNEHLTSSKYAARTDGWIYRQRLIGDYSMPHFWRSVPDTIQIYAGPNPSTTSFNDLDGLEEFVTTVRIVEGSNLIDAALPKLTAEDINARATPLRPVLAEEAIHRLSAPMRRAIFNSRKPGVLTAMGNGYLIISWRKRQPTDKPIWNLSKEENRPVYIAPIEGTNCVAAYIHRTTDSVYQQLILNAHHPVSAWLRDVKAHCDSRQYGLTLEMFGRLMSLVHDAAAYSHYLTNLSTFVERWNKESLDQIGLSCPDLTKDSAIRIRNPNYK